MKQVFVLDPIVINPVTAIETIRDTSFHVGDQRSWAPAWTEWILPWTLVKDKPGIATVFVDISTFWGSHEVLTALRASRRLPGRALQALEATYLAVAIKLGIDPAWVAAVIGTTDIIRHNLFMDRVKNWVEGNTGGLVFQVQQGWFVDP